MIFTISAGDRRISSTTQSTVTQKWYLRSKTSPVSWQVALLGRFSVLKQTWRGLNDSEDIFESSRNFGRRFLLRCFEFRQINFLSSTLYHWIPLVSMNGAGDQRTSKHVCCPKIHEPSERSFSVLSKKKGGERKTWWYSGLPTCSTPHLAQRLACLSALVAFLPWRKVWELWRKDLYTPVYFPFLTGDF